MTPAPGERLLRYVGDRVRFSARDRGERPAPKGWRALLRTNLGRAEQMRREILAAHTHGLPLAGASWRDVPMRPDGAGWCLELPLTQTGFFKAKPYLLDPNGWQHWPEGPDVGISVHPDAYRTANILYCAFPRLFGPTASRNTTSNPGLDKTLAPLDAEGYTVIPPSGKLRDLTKQLPHIFDTLGCKILHLLPVNPTPTTCARFGRFGSPYATLDLAAIDPALVVFDKRTTGIDQFRELTYEAHLRGGRVFLDMVINHTGWSSALQENHPEWFIKNPDGTFASPGAWGVIWEDLIELKHQNVQLWDELSEAFLTWCRRGVDGFRCDAGYKVPVPAWQYIVARVQQEYPATIFFLEGLGGAWAATESLLTDGGMQWAYSELFQNYSGLEVARYLDHSLRQSERVGVLIHYSETHDNDRLAARGPAWSLLRNRLCALASVSGGFGFTCGVEWLASEKIRVHGSTGLAWGNPENLLPELTALNRLLTDHPCFFDRARLERISQTDSHVYALQRTSQQKMDSVLVLLNNDMEKSRLVPLDFSNPPGLAAAPEVNVPAPAKNQFLSALPSWIDLLGQAPPVIEKTGDLKFVVTLAPGAVFCLGPSPTPRGLHGEAYRRARQRAAWGLEALGRQLPAEHIGKVDWHTLADAVESSPAQFLAFVAHLPAGEDQIDLEKGLRDLPPKPFFPKVVLWTLLDKRRITPVAPDHWLLIQDPNPFRASLFGKADSKSQNVESVPVRGGYVACFPPKESPGDRLLGLERYAEADRHVQAEIRYLEYTGGPTPEPHPKDTDIVLLTNGRGGMARLCVDLGRVQSKYDCVLAANLHQTLPVDRHVLIKRIRVWVNADGFISPLNFRSLESFRAGPPAVWNFVANAGDGRTVQVQMCAGMLEGRNETVFRFSRPTAAQAAGKQLPAEADVCLTVRLDIEDRNFHSETRRNGGADYHFSANTHPVPASSARFCGFRFTPAPDRQLCVIAAAGAYHPQPEWSENIPHPIEQSRGQVGSGDAYSPGWFELPLPKGAEVVLVASAEPLDCDALATCKVPPEFQLPPVIETPSAAADSFTHKLLRAVRAFVVRRGEGKTVIAGYPWFLDWGRDTFICARGLLAAGNAEDVKQLVLTFARFEKDGTLPNTIFGENASNRDTSDAPLWFGLVCEELAARIGLVHGLKVAPDRTLLDVLRSIGSRYMTGTPNGIRMDPSSGLIWSPSHFTWMDTNYPACTPREGYPVEIQALWIRLLRHLAVIDAPDQQSRWRAAADQALASLHQLFWLEQRGYYADVLAARPGQSAGEATPDDALRSNYLLVISLGLASGRPAQRSVDAALRYLVVPGALRSLAPLPVSKPLALFGNDGRPLNNPLEPYWGHYEGDEDTRRKPAYHNGTAWTWTFPVFCEALATAWEFSPDAVAAARAYLRSMEQSMDSGCVGQLPELLDGDKPHAQRGCDAQAWAATEALRVWLLLAEKP